MDIGAPTGPHHFRTYAVPKDKTYDCKIWEAARATSAAPTYFPRIEIGPLNRKQAFVNACIGCNNPTNEVIQECELIYGSDAKVACIVSIGTGRPEVIRWEKPGLFQKAFPIKLCKALAKLATDTEGMAEQLQRRFSSDSRTVYWRLNVSRGLQTISLEEWERLGEVEGYTQNYMKEKLVSDQIDKLVDVLIESSGKSTYHVSDTDSLSMPIAISAFSGTGYRLGN